MPHHILIQVSIDTLTERIISMRVSCKSRLKKLREQNHLSQKGIPVAVQIAPRTYSDYESGNSNVPLDVLISLAKYYDVDLNYIAGVSNIRKEFPNL